MGAKLTHAPERTAQHAVNLQTDMEQKEDMGVTLEDLHGEVFEWETCKANKCEMWGFHAGECFRRGPADVQKEWEAELVVNGNDV